MIDTKNLDVDIRIRRATSPIFLTGKSGITPGGYVPHGTGVFVKIKDKYFIFTAGHCAKDVFSKQICICPEDAQFVELDLKNCFHVVSHEGKIDYGVIELEKVSGKIIESGTKIEFARLDDIWIPNHNLTLDYEYSAMGYPEKGKQWIGSHLGIAICKMCGPLGPESFRLTEKTGNMPIEVLELDISMEQLGFDFYKGMKFENQNDFSGMSGTGFWCMKLQKSIDPQKPMNSFVKLFAFLTGHEEKRKIVDGKEIVIIYLVKISSHLKLIADQYEDLKIEFLNRWPELSGIWSHHS